MPEELEKFLSHCVKAFDKNPFKQLKSYWLYVLSRAAITSIKQNKELEEHIRALYIRIDNLENTIKRQSK